MYFEISELIGLLATAFTAGFALAKYLNKTITEKKFSCSVIEKTPKNDNARFGENTRVIIFYQNAEPKTFRKNTYYLLQLVN